MSSTTTRMPQFKCEQVKRPIWNGRPANYQGPPIEVFHPAFSQFRKNCANPKVEPSAIDYANAHAYAQCSMELYSDSERRTVSLYLLAESLGNNWITRTHNDGTAPDGSFLTFTCKKTITKCFLDYKHEIGTGSSDPIIQGGLYHRSHWAANEVCRMFLLCALPYLNLISSIPMFDALAAAQDSFSPLLDRGCVF